MRASFIPYFTPMKQQKSPFNSYNLFPTVNLIQNMVNVYVNCTYFHFPLSRLARKNMLEKWTKTWSVGGLEIRGLQSF